MILHFYDTAPIATYNAILSVGDYVHPSEIIKEYESNIVLGGAFGVGPQKVNSYLTDAGYSTTFTKKPSVPEVEAAFSGTGVAIMEYWTGSGGLHYVMVEYDNGQMIVYNNYNRRETEKSYTSATDFFNQHTKSRPYALITIQ